MTIAQPLLEARAIGRRRPGSDDWLLRDVNLLVSGGERLAITGPTGSGKTLLLRALALLDPIDTGNVLWKGQAILASTAPTYRRHAVYLHQRPALVEGTVEDNLRLPYLLHGWKHAAFDRDRVLNLLQDVRRDSDFLSCSDHNLSGGERQIVALVRALQLEPTLLFLDEPTASLDAESGEAVERLIRRWHQNDPLGNAYLWVSHDRDQAARVSNRTIIVEQGRVTK